MLYFLFEQICAILYNKRILIKFNKAFFLFELILCSISMSPCIYNYPLMICLLIDLLSYINDDFYYLILPIHGL
jgi:hypothetical protein